MNSKLLLLKNLYLKKLIGQKYCKSIELSQIQNIEFVKKDINYIINNCSLCELGKRDKSRFSGLMQVDSIVAFISLKPILKSTNSFEMLKNIANNVFHTNSYSALSIIKCNALGDVVDSHILSCMPYLKEQLIKINPKIVILLGVEAAKHILNTNDDINKLRGRVFTASSIGESKFIVTYSTNEINRNSSFKKHVLDDCLNIIKLMKMQN